MKILTWIKTALTWLKDVFELAKYGIIIFLAVIAILGIRSCQNQKQSKESLSTILTSEIVRTKTESGKNATQAQNWEIKYKSLERIATETNNENKAEISDLNKELIQANETIKDLGLKAKNVQNYIKNELVSKDSLMTNIIFENSPCKFRLEPIKQEFLKLTFKQDDSFKFLGINYEYRTSIYTVLDRKAEPKKRAILKKNIGEKHKILSGAGWLWGWDYFTTSIVEDSCSTINNVVSIEFQK